jgi:hypothetical protein
MQAILQTGALQIRPVPMTCVAGVGLLPAAVSTGIGPSLHWRGIHRFEIKSRNQIRKKPAGSHRYPPAPGIKHLICVLPS